MGFTIKEFFELIKEKEIISSPKKNNEINIEHISVIEAPVENFVRRGELVLTTAIGCHNDTNVFLDFVKEIYELGAAGLVLSFEKDEIKIPKEVIQYTREVFFPVIVIPWKFRYAEIIELVLTRIQNSKSQEHVFGEKIQKKLLKAYLDGKTLIEASKILYDFLGYKVVIVDTNYNVKAQSKNCKYGNFLDQDSLKEFQHIIEIKADYKYFGYMLLGSLQKSEISLTKINQINHYVSMPLTLWFEKEQIINSTKLRLKDDFIWSLAKGDFKSQELMFSQGRLLGFNLNKNYACIVGRIGVLDSANMSQEETDYWINENSILIKELLNEAGARIGKTTMATFQQNMIIIYLEKVIKSSEKEINSYLDFVEKDLKNAIPNIAFSWGISKFNETQISFEKSYADAKLAADLCYNEKGFGYRNTYKDTNIFRVISKLSDESEIRELVNSTLGSLINYDKAKKLNLIKVFNIYVRNNGNISETARQLYLHRQSLLYRLKKIEELCEISLSNHEEVFFIEICIRLMAIYPQMD